MNGTQVLPLVQDASVQQSATQGSGSFVEAAKNAVSSGGDSLFMWSNYFEAIALLCFLLGGLWFFLWIVRRKYHGNVAGSIPTMVIESRLALAPKKWVVITRFMDKRLILGVTEQHVTLLSEMPLTTGGVDSDEEATTRFASMLQAASGNKDT